MRILERTAEQNSVGDAQGLQIARPHADQGMMANIEVVPGP